MIVDGTIIVQTKLGQYPGNIGIEIRTDQHLSNFEIRRYPTSFYDVSGETRLSRFYTLSPESVSSIMNNVEMTVKYRDNELNGVVESDIAPYIIQTDESQEPTPEHVVVSIDTDADEVAYKRLYPQNTILLAYSGADRNLHWTGVEDTDWHNPENWNITGPPSKLYDVNIPNVMNDPIVNNPSLEATSCREIIIETGVFMQVITELILGRQ